MAGSSHTTEDSLRTPLPIDLDEPRRSWFTLPGARMTLLASAFAAGIAVSMNIHFGSMAIFAITAVAAALLAYARLHRPRQAVLAAMIAAAALGCARHHAVHHSAPADDLAALCTDQVLLVRVEGRALAESQRRPRPTGSLSAFDHRTAPTLAPVDVEFIEDDAGRRAVSGRVMLYVDGPAPHFRAGDRLTITGSLVPPGPPLNPAEYDFRTDARSQRQAGLLAVGDPTGIVAHPDPSPPAHYRILRARDWMRAHARRWLLDAPPSHVDHLSDPVDMPRAAPTPAQERRALLALLLLGARDPAADDLDDAFTRVGLAHILAISGMNLGVLAAFVLLALGWAPLSRRWRGLIVIAVVVSYLLMIEVRVPVARAAIMTCITALGLISSRRLSARGLLALSAIIVLWIWPHQLASPGFQLSYGVVIALLELVKPLRTRLFGRQNPDPVTRREMIVSGLKTSCCAAVACWLVATPITLAHFGTVALWGAPASLVTVPIATLVMIVGYLKLLIAIALPPLSTLLAAPLEISADAMIVAVLAIDHLPFAVAHLPLPSLPWTIAALLFAAAWCAHRAPWRERDVLRAVWELWIGGWRFAPAFIILLAWLLWPLHPWREKPALRIDILAVGDGSCWLVRTPESAVVFDAGAAKDFAAGRRLIVPALRRLGVHTLDAIIISHPNLDHYSAVLELVDTFHPPQVLLTPHFLRACDEAPDQAPAYFINELRARDLEPAIISAGWTADFGRSHWIALHPDPDADYRRENDSSIVLRVDAAGRSLLLTGDIQQEAMAHLLAEPDAINVDIMELPHHGSYHELAVEFLHTAEPEIIAQSTGPSRLERDRWPPHIAELHSAHRFITARDGAIWIEISHDGVITSGSFLNPAFPTPTH